MERWPLRLVRRVVCRYLGRVSGPSSEADASPVPRGDRTVVGARQPGTVAFLAAVAIACTSTTLWLTSLTSPLVPKFDEWQVFVPALTGEEPIDASWLWRQINEHRALLPRLAYLLSVQGTGDFRGGAFLNTIVLAATAVIGMWVMRVRRGASRPRDAFFPLMMLHWGQTHLFFLGVALNFTITMALGYSATFATMIARPARLRPLAAWVTVAAIGMVVSSLMGVLMALPWAGWLLVSAWRSAPGDRWWITGLALLIFAAIIVYFWGFQLPGAPLGPAPSRSLLDRFGMLGVLLALSLGWFGRAVGPGAGVLVGLLGCGLGAGLAARAWRREGEVEATGLLAMLLGATLVLIGIVNGRAQIAGEALWATTRYATLSIPILVVAYCASFQWRARGRWLQRALAVLAGVVFIGPLVPFVHYPWAQPVVRDLADRERDLIQRLRAGEASLAVARDFFPHQNGYPAELGAEWIEMLRRHRMGPFAPQSPEPR